MQSHIGVIILESTLFYLYSVFPVTLLWVWFTCTHMQYTYTYYCVWIICKHIYAHVHIILACLWFSLPLSLSYTHAHIITVLSLIHTHIKLLCWTHTHMHTRIMLPDSYTYTTLCVWFICLYTHIHTCALYYCLIHTPNLLMYVSYYFASYAQTLYYCVSNLNADTNLLAHIHTH